MQRHSFETVQEGITIKNVLDGHCLDFVHSNDHLCDSITEKNQGWIQNIGDAFFELFFAELKQCHCRIIMITRKISARAMQKIFSLNAFPKQGEICLDRNEDPYKFTRPERTRLSVD